LNWRAAFRSPAFFKRVDPRSGLTNSLADIGKGVPALEANASAEAKSLINNYDQKRKNAALDFQPAALN
jgi:hypothetical protein